MDKILEKKIEDAIWIGKSLFDRGRATGSSANMSFLHDGDIYVTGTGTCFGRLTRGDFAIVGIEDGVVKSETKPSKELELHKKLYVKDGKIEAVLHTHSFNSTSWSCLKHEDVNDIIPKYTPYLEMKIGKIGLIPYEKPGTKELFDTFEKNLSENKGYLLQNHGPILGHKDLMTAFYSLEELEDSAEVAWQMKNLNIKEVNKI